MRAQQSDTHKRPSPTCFSFDAVCTKGEESFTAHFRRHDGACLAGPAKHFKHITDLLLAGWTIRVASAQESR